jgi:putative transposase
VATAGPIGLDGLTDRSRRPYRHANQLLTQIETLIVRLKQDKPSWGAPKIRERLARLYPDVHTPAISTVHVVLDRHGLVKRAKHRQHLSAELRNSNELRESTGSKSSAWADD